MVGCGKLEAQSQYGTFGQEIVQSFWGIFESLELVKAVTSLASGADDSDDACCGR